MHLSLSLFFLAATLWRADAFNVRRDALSDCLAGHDVPVVMTADPGWDTAVKPYNLRLQDTIDPTIVVVARNEADVKKAMKCAWSTKTQVSVKSGGHSYGAYGLAGTMVLDMSDFQKIAFSNGTDIVIVGAGVRLGNMAKGLYELSGRALPHGTCAGVGIGGHATLGGFGLDSRLWGLTIDVVESMRVVKADGRKALEVSATKNAELFWGLRGAGASNFGVVTEFRLKTFVAPRENTHFGYQYTFADSGKLARALVVMQRWGLEKAPKELGYGFLLFPGGTVNLRGVYYGPKDVFETLIAPLLDELKVIYDGRVPVTTVSVKGWLESLEYLNGGPLEVPLKGYDSHDTFYAKSLVAPEDRPISVGAASSFAAYLQFVPTTASWYVICNLYGGPGSVINSVPANSTSYRHRSSGYVWQFVASGGPEANVVEYVKNMVSSFGNEIDGYPAYAPYADPELEDPQTAYWGDNVERLRELKKVWDADDILLNPQGF
ncbi:FAD-binding domain-containing protein [Ascodesmis nigricans]|uniref:FAD-binding domain-containing protein n=1 Tax=Ascodesmis nigricans TaxID=341454 RepID=A0A4S2MSC3_9PEZI|nr:FAD-binding domain-containing protein [Ascodesmis nigricans]